jgi:hypothetical protein
VVEEADIVGVPVCDPRRGGNDVDGRRGVVVVVVTTTAVSVIAAAAVATVSSVPFDRALQKDDWDLRIVCVCVVIVVVVAG